MANIILTAAAAVLQINALTHVKTSPKTRELALSVVVVLQQLVVVGMDE